MNKYSKSTRRELMKIYRKFGIEKTIEVAYGALISKKDKEGKDFISSFHGEICETILELILKEYIKRKDIKDWYISKSLIIPSNNTTTELDITLFTPKMIYIFECKCYGGNKVITDNCTINRKGKQSMNVYEQNCFHRDMLDSVINKFRFITANSKERYKLIYFDFSEGSIKDERTELNKRLMPIKRFHNVIKLFKDYNSLDNQWDMRKIVPVIRELENLHDVLEEKHLKRLGVI